MAFLGRIRASWPGIQQWGHKYLNNPRFSLWRVAKRGAVIDGGFVLLAGYWPGVVPTVAVSSVIELGKFTLRKPPIDSSASDLPSIDLKV